MVKDIASHYRYLNLERARGFSLNPVDTKNKYVGEITLETLIKSKVHRKLYLDPDTNIYHYSHQQLSEICGMSPQSLYRRYKNNPDTYVTLVISECSMEYLQTLNINLTKLN